MSQKQKKLRVHFYFSNLVQTHIIQKNEKKTVLKESDFVCQNREKVILYKLTKSIFVFFDPYYTTSVRFVTVKQWIHTRLFFDGINRW